MSNKAFDIDDWTFDSTDINGKDLKSKHQAASGDTNGSSAITWIKEKGKNTIRHLGADEKVPVANIEKVGVTEPFDTASKNLSMEVADTTVKNSIVRH